MDAVDLGIWRPNIFIKGSETITLMNGLSVAIKPLGKTTYEMNLVGNKSEFIAETIEEAKTHALSETSRLLEAAITRIPKAK